jgi:hypothetical protein
VTIFNIYNTYIHRNVVTTALLERHVRALRRIREAGALFIKNFTVTKHKSTSPKGG